MDGDTVETLENLNPYIEKDLEGALDSFDNLFCRRCYVITFFNLLFFRLVKAAFVNLTFCCCYLYLQVFDCRLHGCSQDLIFPVRS